MEVDIKSKKIHARYDDGKQFDLPTEAINAIEELGRVLMRCQRSAEPEYAHCWRVFSWSIDDNFQPAFSFGGSVDDIETGKDWIVARP